MEEKVKNILIILEEDADSFARRAEMYYRQRPELINFVEESYKSYRALAERYDHISGELQNANNTLAAAFPDQVPMSIDDDDDIEHRPKMILADPSKVPKTPDNPKFKLLAGNAKKSLPKRPKKMQPKKPCSNMTNEEAQEEIDKLQKGILVLQTEKEFVMSSYESGLAKAWEIEKQIEEKQEKVFDLQDDFGVSKVIEDNEARALMTASALKSCEETLAQLQEQQKRSIDEARVEAERIKDAEKKLRALKGGHLEDEIDDQKLPENSIIEDSMNDNIKDEISYLKEERLELQSICVKIKEYFEVNADSSLSVTELAEKVDELVNKVLSLENAVSSQIALIKRLRLETEELQKHLYSLEEDKEPLIDDSKNLNEKIRELEQELTGVQDLNRSVKDKGNKLQTNFTEVCHGLNDLSEELRSPHQHEVVETTASQMLEERNVVNAGTSRQMEGKEDVMTQSDGLVDLKNENAEQVISEIEENHVQSEKLGVQKQQDDAENKGSSKEENVSFVGGDAPNWQQLFLSGLADREKILLTEYTSILRNYKEVKKRLSEMENKSQESLSETTAQIRELKNANAGKDAEIRSLQQKLSILQAKLEKNKDNHPEDSENTIEHWKSLFSNLQAKTGQKNLRRLEELLKEQDILESPMRMDESSTSVSKETPQSEDKINTAAISEHHPVSAVEEKFRRDIDELLEENLEFWLRFSESFQQIQKFQTSLQELQTEYKKLKSEDKKRENNLSAADHAADCAAKSEAMKIEKHLRQLKAELSAWLEKNDSLKDELQRRLSSLSNIQEEISRVLKMHFDTEKSEFTTQQAAKFQGEVLNMLQENNKVAMEQQTGLDHVRRLQLEIDMILSGSKSTRHHQFIKHTTSRTRIPLRYFIFGVKPKKQSIFACINPTIPKEYAELRAAGAGPPIQN
ncbi:hypothetical protein ACLOJK_003097 [Asimina triloba]